MTIATLINICLNSYGIYLYFHIFLVKARWVLRICYDFSTSRNDVFEIRHNDLPLQFCWAAHFRCIRTCSWALRHTHYIRCQFLRSLRSCWTFISVLYTKLFLKHNYPVELNQDTSIIFPSYFGWDYDIIFIKDKIFRN